MIVVIVVAQESNIRQFVNFSHMSVVTITREQTVICSKTHSLCGGLIASVLVPRSSGPGLRSFPSIALRIPTAHNFTRD